MEAKPTEPDHQRCTSRFPRLKLENRTGLSWQNCAPGDLLRHTQMLLSWSLQHFDNILCEIGSFLISIKGDRHYSSSLSSPEIS